MVIWCFLFASCQGNRLKDLLRKALDDHIPTNTKNQNAGNPNTENQDTSNPNVRTGKQIHSADPGALMYLPIGGSGNIRYDYWLVTVRFKVVQ